MNQFADGVNFEFFYKILTAELEYLPYPFYCCRKEELKQATIRQHYYPEGGWGFVVVIVAVIVQIITHGLQLSFGILILAIKRRWPDADFVQMSEYLFNSFRDPFRF